MSLKSKLELDKEDEAEAVMNYGKRKFQTSDPKLSSMLGGIQKQEKGHHRKLTKAIEGLKKVRG